MKSDVRTWMNVFDVPGQQCVEERVEGHHEQHQLQTELVVFDRRHGHVGPLDTDALDLVECKVLGAEAKRRRRQHRLDTDTSPRASVITRSV